MKLLKGIGAILAGFLVVVVLSTATDAILEALNIFPSPTSGVPFDVTWMIILALVYRTIYTILGGYVVAFIAPQPKMKYVIALAIIGTLAGVAGVVGTWGKGFGPAYYPILLAVLAFPSVYLGGMLKTRKK